MNSNRSGSGRAATLPVGYPPFPGMMVPAHPPFSPMMVPAHVSYPGMRGPAHPPFFSPMMVPAHVSFPGMMGPAHPGFPGMPAQAPFPGMTGPAHAPFPPLQMVPVYAPFPGHPSYLSFVTPVCTNLPTIEERGMAAVDVIMIKSFWGHFCPHRCELKRNKTKSDSADGKVCYKEFTCCGTAALCCRLHCGEIVFSMEGQHAGFIVLPPVPFKIKLKGAAAATIVAAPSHLSQQDPTSEMPQRQERTDQDAMGHEEEEDEEVIEEQAQEIPMASSTVDFQSNAACDNSDSDDDDEEETTRPSGVEAAPEIDVRPVPGTGPTDGSESNITVIPFPSTAGTGQEDADHGRVSDGSGDTATGSSSPPPEPTFEQVRMHLVEAFKAQEAHDHLKSLTRNVTERTKNKKYVDLIGGKRFEVFLGASSIGDNCAGWICLLNWSHPTLRHVLLLRLPS
jgi:hypothetical protein